MALQHLQHYLWTREDRGLYSANKQQTDRFYKVNKKTNKYLLSIRNDLIRLEHNPSSIAEYWVRVPVKLVKDGNSKRCQDLRVQTIQAR